MKVYSPYRRIIHAFTAKYFRGYGVHSPFIYAYVRNVVIRRKPYPKNELLTVFLHEVLPHKYIPMIVRTVGYFNIGLVTTDTSELHIGRNSEDNALIITKDINKITNQTNILLTPYRNRTKVAEWKQWYEQNDAVILDFGEILVIFLNKKLKKQYYRIRK